MRTGLNLCLVPIAFPQNISKIHIFLAQYSHKWRSDGETFQKGNKDFVHDYCKTGKITISQVSSRI